jgi:hypothetical protein
MWFKNFIHGYREIGGLGIDLFLKVDYKERARYYTGPWLSWLELRTHNP